MEENCTWLLGKFPMSAQCEVVECMIFVASQLLRLVGLLCASSTGLKNYRALRALYTFLLIIAAFADCNCIYTFLEPTMPADSAVHKAENTWSCGFVMTTEVSK